MFFRRKYLMKRFIDYKEEEFVADELVEKKIHSVMKLAGAAVYVSKIRNITKRIKNEEELSRKVELLSEQISLQTYVNALVAYKVFSG